ncbi:MAG: DMT family transporter [Burkholderiales bacterium]|nr:DMT family transporter [Burkholderiales bacterium]
MHRHALVTGTLFALAAGLMWGLVFIAPVLLPEYPAALLSFARYLAFGLVALPLAWLDRANLALLTRADWIEALKLGAVGNVLYYLFLAAAIQRAGVPLPSMIIGTLPVVIAVASNLRDHARDGRLPWARLAPSLVLIALGIAAVNQAELARHAAGTAPDAPHGGGFDPGAHALGALLALGAVACWTWYPLRNADWLRAHASRSPRSWATAQGVATLPLAALGFAGLWAVSALAPGSAMSAAGGGTFEMPLGPRPLLFLTLMFAIGFLASWLGTLCWNEASQRLPTTLTGQLIVFETLSALGYAFALRGEMPGALALCGIALLVVGVAWALRAPPPRGGRPAAPVEAPH